MGWLKAVLGSLAMIALCGVAYLGYQAWTAHQRAAQAHANVDAVAKSSASQAAAGHDAVQAVQAQATAEATIHAIGSTNAADVKATPGAEKPFDPALYQAALRGHCRRQPSDPSCASLRHKGS